MSNLPPGVESHMIPGNRPEDVAYDVNAESIYDFLIERFQTYPDDFSPDDLSTLDLAVDSLLDLVSRYRREVGPTDRQESVCRNCERRIVNEGGEWIDPEATGDDSVWRETCDRSKAFTAEHVPGRSTRRQRGHEDMTDKQATQTHTPGPWVIGNPKRDGTRTVWGGSDRDIPMIVANTFEDADARLIAAAPDLLHAARMALAENYGEVTEGWDATQGLLDAIAKAEGR